MGHIDGKYFVKCGKCKIITTDTTGWIEDIPIGKNTGAPCHLENSRGKKCGGVRKMVCGMRKEVVEDILNGNFKSEEWK